MGSTLWATELLDIAEDARRWLMVDTRPPRLAEVPWKNGTCMLRKNMGNLSQKVTSRVGPCQSLQKNDDESQSSYFLLTEEDYSGMGMPTFTNPLKNSDH